jgi:branched-chain amino acid transport system substrate-binding protein
VAIATYKKWTGRDKVVVIYGWGTADTEALSPSSPTTRWSTCPHSYQRLLTDPTGAGKQVDGRTRRTTSSTAQSYSDALPRAW